MSEVGTPHDPFARECVIVGLPASELHDRPCPACQEMRALIDLDPDFGPASEGRPFVGDAVRLTRLAPEDRSRVHNHRPWRPMCNERTVGDQLRGACLNDDGTDRVQWWQEPTS